MLSSTSGFQLHYDIGYVCIVTSKASQKVNAEGACGPLYIYGYLVGVCAFSFYCPDLL